MSKTRRQKEKIIMIFLKLTVVTHCSSVVYSQEDHKQVVMIYFFPLQILFLLFQILYRILKKKKKKSERCFKVDVSVISHVLVGVGIYFSMNSDIR